MERRQHFDDMHARYRKQADAEARYYRPGRVAMSPDIARPALASYLVQMAKDGVVYKSKLAAGGVLYLNSLTLKEPGNRSA